MNQAAREQLPDHESVLLDYVERLSKYREGRRAIHVHLSRLRPYNRREHHLRIAASAFEALVRGYEGAQFRLFNDDLIVICKGATVATIDEFVLRLRFLFSEDPLLIGHEEEGEEFCTWYDVEQDHPAFLGLAGDLVEARARDEAERAAAAAAAQPDPQAAPCLPLDPPHLASIVKAISQADITSMMRRQPVCAVVPDEKPRPVFHEVFVSVDALRQTLLPSHDILADRWLFQALTRHFDKRTLAMLSRNDDASIDQSFSINLNIETVLSPEFMEFDETLKESARGTIIIEFQVLDVFADIGGFIFARDFLHGRGYRLCLDGTTHISLPFVDREKLGFDLIKLQWSSDLADRLHGAQGDILRKAVAVQSPDRLIMNRSDSDVAVEVGLGLGIVMFQGHVLDRMLADGTSHKDAIQNLSAAKARHRAASRTNDVRR